MEKGSSWDQCGGNRQWCQQVLLRLDELADKEYQERVWVRGEGEEVSSFVEAGCGLYDDTGLIDLLEETPSGRYVISKQIDDLLRQLDQLTQKFAGQCYSPEIIQLPEWSTVLELAAKTATLLRQHIVRETTEVEQK